MKGGIAPYGAFAPYPLPSGLAMGGYARHNLWDDM